MDTDIAEKIGSRQAIKAVTIGLIIAYTKGFYDTRTIKNFTQEIKNQVFGATNSVAQKGYAMDVGISSRRNRRKGEDREENRMAFRTTGRFKESSCRVLPRNGK